MENTHKSKFSIQEVKELYADAEQIKIYDALDNFGLDEYQIKHMLDLDEGVRPRLALTRLVSLLKEKEEVKKQMQKNTTTDESLLHFYDYLNRKNIYYLGDTEEFVMLEPVGYEDEPHNYKWTTLTFKQIKERYDNGDHPTARIKTLDDILLDSRVDSGIGAIFKNALCYLGGRKTTRRFNFRTSSSRRMEDETLNMCEVEKEKWIINSDEYYLADPSKPDPYIKALLWSISGEKQENFDHICKCIMWKLKGNVMHTLPSLVLFGGQGSGKSTFTSVLMPTVFHGSSSCVSGKIDDLSRFNSYMEGAHLVYFDEAKLDKRFNEELKKTIGNVSIPIEKKGQDKYYIDNLAWYVFCTNDEFGAVALSQDASENRRFSICKGNDALWKVITREFGVITEAEAREIEQRVMKACKDRKAVAQTIKWIEKTYWESMNNRCPRALHGEDYENLLGMQKSDKDHLAEDILMSCVKNETLAPMRDCVKLWRERAGTTRHSNYDERAIKTLFAEVAKRNGWNITGDKRKKVDGVTYNPNVIVTGAEFKQVVYSEMERNFDQYISHREFEETTGGMEIDPSIKVSGGDFDFSGLYSAANDDELEELLK